MAQFIKPHLPGNRLLQRKAVRPIRVERMRHNPALVCITWAVSGRTDSQMGLEMDAEELRELGRIVRAGIKLLGEG